MIRSLFGMGLFEVIIKTESSWETSFFTVPFALFGPFQVIGVILFSGLMFDGVKVIF